MKTSKEWIEAFDRGEEIQTVSMGGMGDGYEKAIQSCAVEIIRILNNYMVPDDDHAFIETIRSAENKVIKILDPIHGFSGAQVGAAKNLASVIWRRGPLAMAEVPDRVIKIKKAQQPYLVELVP